jgi:ABC-type branched-subunit amino acid transport system substrate-binding protein
MLKRILTCVAAVACAGAPLACVSLATPAPRPSAPASENTTTQPGGQQQPEEPENTSDEVKLEVVDPVDVEVAEQPLSPEWEALIAGPLEALVDAVDGAGEPVLKKALERAEGEAKQAIQLRLALLHLHRGVVFDPPDAAPESLQAVLAQARALASAMSASRPARVGLLLPQDRPWGEVLEKAFRFGLGEEELEVVVASSENPEAGMQTLIFEHGVSLVVCGPFLKRSQRAAVVAQRLGVPLVSLGRDENLVSLGPGVFQVGLTNHGQIDRLVQGAMEQRGYQRFAIMFPRTGSGWRASERFEQQVEARGGSVVHRIPYPKGETTFTGLISRMVGRDGEALNSNPLYRKCVAKIPKTLKGLRKKRQVESCRDHTPPSVEFDAIFIPDSVASVRQIMPFIELSDMVPNLNERVLWRTRKATSNNKLTPTPILGMRQLNSHYFATRSRTDVEGSLFVDAYYPYDKSRALPGVFARQFRKTFSRAPDLLEILAYDVGKMVAHLAASSRLNTRRMALDAVSQIRDFDAVTGPWSMGASGQVERPLYLLSIHKRRIVTEADRQAAKARKKQKRRGR